MKTFLFLSFYLFYLTGFSQDTATKADLKAEPINVTKYTLTDRRNLYPFSQAAEIKIVSFDKQEKEIDSSDWRFKIKSFKNHKDISYGLPVINDTICFSKLDKIVPLNFNQADTITDILYNTCYRWTVIDKTSLNCYLPHNAIIFFDKSGKVFEYIEICFDCHGMRYNARKIENFEKCDLTFNDLQKYFKSLGLKTGFYDFEPRQKK